MFRTLILALVAGLVVVPPAVAQSTLDQIGVLTLRNRLGPAAPTGAGVSVMHAEAQVALNAYLPDPNDSHFVGKTFTDESGNGLFSGHANGVGRFFYGINFGVAPGITDVHNYRVDGLLGAGDWFGPAYLNFNGGLPVVKASERVQNHSWVDTDPFNAAAQQAQRRYDFALRRDNVIGVVGVNNGFGSPVPALLGNTYNGIAVGLTNADSSHGPSTGDVPGRAKPDIVAPENFTSFSTPQVAGAAAVLLETTDGMGGGNAGRMETIKAALLTGATKDEFRFLGQPWTRTNNGSFVEPLDRRFGAGELNVNNSHLVLTGGEKNGTDLALDGTQGWDYETLTGVGAGRRYFFDVAELQNVRFSATATWLRRITPTGTGANVFATSDATLSLVELRLFEANPDFSLGTMVDSSVSPIDNVQHLFDMNLTGGRYALELTLAGLPGGQGSEEVAVAWLVDFAAVPEPGALALTGVAGAVGAVLAWRRRKVLRAES